MKNPYHRSSDLLYTSVNIDSLELPKDSRMQFAKRATGNYATHLPCKQPVRFVYAKIIQQRHSSCFVLCYANRENMGNSCVWGRYHHSCVWSSSFFPIEKIIPQTFL